MRRVFKYPLALADTQSVEIPDGGTILAVQDQAGQLCLWALVDPARPAASRQIEIRGTGHAVPGGGEMAYLGTVQQASGGLVWHVFERVGAGRGQGSRARGADSGGPIARDIRPTTEGKQR